MLRIDDLDTPRNQPGADTAILKCLESFGLHWDGQVDYQSSHQDQYQSAIAALGLNNHTYPCYCSRKQLSEYPGIYPGLCRNLAFQADQQHALRLKTPHTVIAFNDRLQGPVIENIGSQYGDFVIRRKDAIVAYQLAVVIDDHRQQVNHVVRGFDLLESTSRQLYLQQLLDYQSPDYMHIPVIVDHQGHKLSKQTGAQAVAPSQPSRVLFQLLDLLKQHPPAELRGSPVNEILQWAIEHWQPNSLYQQSSLTLD